MKPIIIDMDNMSSTLEVYNNRTNPIHIIFIWFIFIMLTILLILSCTFSFDEVVSADGVVQPHDLQRTYKSELTGKLNRWLIEDGLKVKKGDLLYSINPENLEQDQKTLKNKLSDINFELEIAGAYLSYLQGEEVSFEDYISNPFYKEYMNRKNSLKLNLNMVDIEKTETNQSQSSGKVAKEKTIAKNKNDIDNLNQLRQAIKNKKNVFDQSDSFYYDKVEKFLADLDMTTKEYDLQISKGLENIERLNKDKENLLNQMAVEEKELLDKRIQAKEEEISNTGIEESSENAIQGNALDGDSIASSQNPNSFLREVLSVETKTKIEIEVREEIKKKYEDQLESIDASMNAQVEAVEELKENKMKSLNQLELDTITAVEQQIKNKEELLFDLETQLSSSFSGLDEKYSNRKEQSKVAEISAVTDQLRALKIDKQELDAQLNKMTGDLDNLEVVADRNGVIRMKSNHMEGEMVQLGEELFYIIADTNSYVVDVFVSNFNIGQIKEGMDVKLEFPSLSSSEFEKVQGEVLSISEGITYSLENGQFYTVQTIIDQTESQGNENKLPLRVGMACKARFVVSKRKIISLFLDQLGLS